MGNEIKTKELKRMNYFDGLFLKAEDYKLEREYHRRIQGLHNRYLHSWGIFYGLEVKPVIDSEMTVYVTEGMALDLTENGIYADSNLAPSDAENNILKESSSRQIIIYEGHPDNPIDLSECIDPVGKDIYIFVSYYEKKADWDSDGGQGKEKHIWEFGKLEYSYKKPENVKEKIMLARIVPKAVYVNDVMQPIIDNTCIFDTYRDGTPLRIYGGVACSETGIEKFTFSYEEYDEKLLPSVLITGLTKKDNEVEEEAYIKNQLLFKYDKTHKVDILGNVKVGFTEKEALEKRNIKCGQIVTKKNGKLTEETAFEDDYLQLNSRTAKKQTKDEIGKTVIGNEQFELDKWKLDDGGLNVFRGGTPDFPDACIRWSEKEQRWKAGLDKDLYTIAYGENWRKLNAKIDAEPDGSIKDGKIKDTQSCDELHFHSRLYSGTEKEVVPINTDTSGNISVISDITLEKDKKFIAKTEKMLGELSVSGALQGPILLGSKSGILGTKFEGEKIALSWNNEGKVGIGTTEPTEIGLDISESCRFLVGSNPLRITSTWTAFPDHTSNQAEICNDTTYHKALMIVGNQSAGQGRKVAIWDRLDVNGLLYINGSMQVSNKFAISAGEGKKGIVFPVNPGGGFGDAAWIKYYPRKNPLTGAVTEACTLEIGTTNDNTDNILLNVSGNIGIKNRNPQDKLDVISNARIMSSTNPIFFTDKYKGFSYNSPNFSEISNDTATYKSLMILGNNSGGNIRRVSIWDDLYVNGSLKTGGGIQYMGAIKASAGNSEAKGIMFPKDPGGGSGDAAWIRYYSDTKRGGGENMTLEIGASNDTNIQTYTVNNWIVTCPWIRDNNFARQWNLGNLTNYCGYWNTQTYWYYGNVGDRIRFYASGGTYIDGNFYNASSREYKENITDLSPTVARKAIEAIEPVEFNFKGDYNKKTIGFIAEDVPDVFAGNDKKAISPLEIIAVLVGEVKEQEKEINQLRELVAAL